MNLTMAYLGRSGVFGGAGGRVLQLAPNLTREQVAFDAPLREVVRFREAISSLHDVVISDLRFKPRDKTAYAEWKKQQTAREAETRRTEYARAKDKILAQQKTPVSPDLEKDYRRCLSRYWQARRAYANYLLKHDMELWRKLMPCDPVITVADDIVFFECFSADESSYGCLSVDREAAFGQTDGVRLGTTNVDYSWDLYEHFQSLRTYRETRFRIDPAGFDVAVKGQADYREEKIDLPPGWLRGFMQIQAAMGMPMRRVSLSVEAVYSLLAWLRRHRPQTSPRAVRFELMDGQAPVLKLEPWEQTIVSHATRYQGPEGEPIRIWGRNRLLVLARVLPLADSVDVYLLGTGLPSFWLVRMGAMRLTLGVSGWTTNDWTRSSSLDLLLAPQRPSESMITMVAEFLRRERAAEFKRIDGHVGGSPALTAAALNHLAHTGQVIYDLAAGRFRWRQIMPMALGEAEMGPPNAELTGASELIARRKVRIESKQDIGGGRLLLSGKADDKPCEVLVDADGAIRRGKCVCGHFRKAGIRMGPCRHLQALRTWAAEEDARAQRTADEGLSWYDKMLKWSGNRT